MKHSRLNILWNSLPSVSKFPIAFAEMSTTKLPREQCRNEHTGRIEKSPRRKRKFCIGQRGGADSLNCFCDFHNIRRLIQQLAEPKVTVSDLVHANTAWTCIRRTHGRKVSEYCIFFLIRLLWFETMLSTIQYGRGKRFSDECLENHSYIYLVFIVCGHGSPCRAWYLFGGSFDLIHHPSSSHESFSQLGDTGVLWKRGWVLVPCLVRTTLCGHLHMLSLHSMGQCCTARRLLLCPIRSPWQIYIRTYYIPLWGLISSVCVYLSMFVCILSVLFETIDYSHFAYICMNVRMYDLQHIYCLTLVNNGRRFTFG